jgi:hypothetical protein
MAIKTDATISNNVANLDELIVCINGYGATYNPTKESIKLTALQSLSAQAKQITEDYNIALANQKNATAAREVAFKPLSALATRLKNAVAATDTTEHVDNNVKSIVRKLLGQRASTKKTEEEIKTLKAAGKEVVEISSSQMGYDSRLNNFNKLIALLASISLYAPNEIELKVATLTEYYNNLKNLNSAVVVANTAIDNARIARNQLLYAANTGLYDIATSVKAYIKSVYGAKSPQFKQVSGLKFTNKSN